MDGCGIYGNKLNSACLWLEKTLPALHSLGTALPAGTPPVPCWAPKCKEAKAQLADRHHEALFSFQRGEQC